MSEQARGQGATLERQALAALRKMRQKLDEIELARTEPIAIVGVGCRLPGGANDPETFWDLLQNGVDAIREVPADRWKVEEYFDPNPGTPGKTCSRWGGFMDQIDRFDPEFFGISPREAIHMDPQQRIFLEVAWGSAGKRWYSPFHAQRFEHRRVRRHDDDRLSSATSPVRQFQRSGCLYHFGQHDKCDFRPALLFPRHTWPFDHDGHGLFILFSGRGSRVSQFAGR